MYLQDCPKRKRFTSVSNSAPTSHLDDTALDEQRRKRTNNPNETARKRSRVEANLERTPSTGNR